MLKNTTKKKNETRKQTTKSKATRIKGHFSKSVKKNKLQGSIPKLETIKNDEESDEDLLEMIDESDLDFLKKAVLSRSYDILKKIKYSEEGSPKLKRQKMAVNDEDLEEQYESVAINEPVVMKRNLLPIKTKTALIPQAVVKNKKEEEELDMEEGKVDMQEENEDEIQNNNYEYAKPISTTELLVLRNQKLQQRKLDIGILSSGFLENAEEKVSNLKILLDMIDEEIPEIHYTVKKLVIMSLLEIFKDVLPSYEIKVIRQEGVKLKKDTLKLQKYEESLVLYYRKYLQILEKFAFRIIKKNSHAKNVSEEEIHLSILAIDAMCQLLITHPYFNFSQNIAQAVVPLMNNRNKRVREIIMNSLKNVFKDDKKGEITLQILRLINNFIKVHPNHVHTEMVEVLLVLNLKGASLDHEKEIDNKQKKLKAHKSRILQLSKKERKRMKKLKEVEKELLETKAEENKDIKMRTLTEITKMVFNIYFRILKNTDNTKLLGACFEGLAKFAHYINLEFSLNIITTLDKLLDEDWLSQKESLHCMQTVFAILSGQGEALNVDPSRFYNRLYKDLLKFNLRHSEIVLNLIKTLNVALVERRKKITNKRTIGFVKRITTLCLQLLHDGSIGCLAVVKTIMTLNRFVDILLDTDTSVGEGTFLWDVEDPEYCNASNTALYEIIPLMRHYHPTVNTFANQIANGLNSNPQKNASGIYGKMSPEQLYTTFNMSEMTFNPPVPIPKVSEPKSKLRSTFADQQFHNECKEILKKSKEQMFFAEVII